MQLLLLILLMAALRCDSGLLFGPTSCRNTTVKELITIMQYII